LAAVVLKALTGETASMAVSLRKPKTVAAAQAV
jgi:hypothetical protein